MTKQTEALKLALEFIDANADGADERAIATLIREALALVNEVDQEDSSGTEQQAILECHVQARPLSHSLHDYHIAMSEGPLHFTWTDKPHRLVYDLIAAVKYYAAPQPDMNLNCKSVQARLAASWGYVKAEQPAQQEPVALVEEFSLLLWDYQELERAFEKVTGGKWIRKSNTPQRTWVGLTDEETHEAIGTAGVDLLELAKLWSDNKIHVYQFDNEARKIIKGVLHRAYGIKGDA